MSWAGRVSAVVMVVGAMAAGQVITTLADVNRAELPPFVETGSVGDVVELSYADVQVDGVRAAQYLGTIGMDAIAAHEHEITAYALAGLRTVPGLRILGPNTGWQNPDGTRWGRSVDAVPGPDGRLYVTDDAAGLVYRITPRG